MKKSFFAEFIGTFFLIFASGCAVILSHITTQVSYAMSIMSFSLILGVLYCLLSTVSGAQFNPAISFAYYVTGKMNLGQLLLYFLAQILGGLVACVMLLVVFANKFDTYIVAVNNEVLHFDDLSASSVIVIFEFLCAFLLAAIYMMLDNHDNKLVCGIVLSALYMGMGFLLTYIDGCGLNVIRILIPALLYNKWKNIVFYLVAVFVGATVGGISYSLLLKKVSQE